MTTLNVNNIAAKAAELVRKLLPDDAHDADIAGAVCSAHALSVCNSVHGGDECAEAAVLATAYLAAAALVTVEGAPSTVKAGDFSATDDAAQRAAAYRADAARVLAPYTAAPLTAVRG